MSHLIETIRIQDGNIHHIGLHNQRLNHSRQRLFGCSDIIDLLDWIQPAPAFQNGRVKCRVLYGQHIQRVTYESYHIRSVHSLKLVTDDFIEYDLKYSDRDRLHQLYAQRANCDNIIIVKQGQLTDSWYANIVLETQTGQLFTPSQPLLKGVKRAALLQNGRIKATHIRTSDLAHFKQVHLINAMLDLGEVVIAVEDVK